jgi:hypothetical protein
LIDCPLAHDQKALYINQVIQKKIVDIMIKPTKKTFFLIGLWSWLADKLHFILSYEAGFYKPTFHKVHPPICRITAYGTMPG